MFNDTTFDFPRRSFEVKQPTSLQSWTNIRARLPELHDDLGDGRRSTELAVSERELRPDTVDQAAQHDAQPVLSVGHRRRFELLHSFRDADEVEGGYLVSKGLVLVVPPHVEHLLSAN